MLKYPVFLIGLMGSGKTHWGNRLAEHLKVKFLDLDQLIEQQEGISISVIFQNFGETKFRNLETHYLRNLDNTLEAVVALGGGTPCHDDNMVFINQIGTSVYLKTSIELVVARMTKVAANRPLLKGKNEDELCAFFKNQLLEREPFYLQADFTINADKLENERQIVETLSA